MRQLFDWNVLFLWVMIFCVFLRVNTNIYSQDIACKRLSSLPTHKMVQPFGIVRSVAAHVAEEMARF